MDNSITNDAFCATIGFFDGVHRGHQFVIDRLKQTAKDGGMKSMVITFDLHPRQVVHASYVPQLLTSTDTKLRLLEATGVDRVEVLHFDLQLAQLSAKEFMQHVLHNRLGVRRLLIGYDNRFGHNRAEGFDQYAAYGKDMGIDVLLNTPVDVDGLRVSSSLVRRLLAEGNVAEACRCLGRPYRIAGNVVHGFEEGRKMGFPTANIAPLCTEQLIPQTGAYAVSVSIEGGKGMPAMMNIGNNPTFQRNIQTLEAHIIGFEGDIYGRQVSVDFIQRLRGEERFGSVDELMAQLQKDLNATKQIWSTQRHSPTIANKNNSII